MLFLSGRNALPQVHWFSTFAQASYIVLFVITYPCVPRSALRISTSVPSHSCPGSLFIASASLVSALKTRRVPSLYIVGALIGSLQILDSIFPRCCHLVYRPRFRDPCFDRGHLLHQLAVKPMPRLFFHGIARPASNNASFFHPVDILPLRSLPSLVNCMISRVGMNQPPQHLRSVSPDFRALLAF
jgi:hypothetical protein